jgi:hypothetical protein
VEFCIFSLAIESNMGRNLTDRTKIQLF